MKKLLAVFGITLALAAFAQADYYVKSKVHTDPISMMGQSQPAKDEFQEQWIGNDRFALITSEQSSFMDLKKNTIVLINHRNKTYVETTLPLDLAKLLPDEMAAMAGMMKATITVQATGQTKTIGQWACTGYTVNMSMMMMPIKIQVWASENVPFLRLYQDKMFSDVMKGTMRLDDTAIAEMKKIKGYWIASESTMEMMGSKMRTASEVVEISEKAPGPQVFKIPAGYTKTAKLSIR